MSLKRPPPVRKVTAVPFLVSASSCTYDGDADQDDDDGDNDNVGDDVSDDDYDGDDDGGDGADDNEEDDDDGGCIFKGTSHDCPISTPA